MPPSAAAQRYLLGDDAAAAERLRVLDAVYGVSSRALLDRTLNECGWGLSAPTIQVAQASSLRTMMTPQAGSLRHSKGRGAEAPPTFRTGLRCADIGCGTGLVALAIAERVGKSGRVVGVDQAEFFLDEARRAAAERGLDNVEFVTGDACALATAEVWSPGFSRQTLSAASDGFAVSESFLRHRSAPAKAGTPNLSELPASFDLIYSRCLLSHLSDPLRALQAMTCLARPGGCVVVEDIDCGGVFAHPEATALMRHLDLYQKVMRLHGGDPLMGRKLPRLCRQAGLTDVHFEIVTPTEPAEAVKRLYPMTLACLKPAIVGAALATPAEVDALVAELQSLADDPNETMSSTPMVQVWARKP
ncbi:MAG: methyltransferase domain-containing protein [Verrucomicrobia bacterium]|nr:methyltransferase domain-containing protein [Verrucomicrobiota bacterium]